MKYLLVTVLIVMMFWLWRHNRQTEKTEADIARAKKRREPEIAATEIVACDFCQVHLPKSEALINQRGIYCSDAHRRQAGG